MSLGTVLDVAFGLALVFVLASTVASAIQEIIATVLSTRGKVLADMMRQVLAETPAGTPVAAPAGTPVAAPAGTPAAAPSGTPAGVPMPSSLSERVLGHPLIAGLGTSNQPEWLTKLTGAKPSPSYIPAGNFATALVETLREGHDQTLAVASQVERAISLMPDDSPVKRTLQAFIVEAKGDVDAFRARVQTWYDDAMDRASGVYKRFSQYMLLGIGLGLAVAINIDVLRIADTLWHDKGARDIVDQAATSYLATHTPPTPANATIDASIKQIHDATGVLEGLPLPIGWSHPLEGLSEQGACHAIWIFIQKIIGFLLTAFAVSLGAPFWFDMLQNISNLRGSGPKPARGQPDDAPGS